MITTPLLVDLRSCRSRFRRAKSSGGQWYSGLKRWRSTRLSMRCCMWYHKGAVKAICSKPWSLWCSVGRHNPKLHAELTTMEQFKVRGKNGGFSANKSCRTIGSWFWKRYLVQIKNQLPLVTLKEMISEKQDDIQAISPWFQSTF